MALQRYLDLYIRCNGNDAELFLIVKMTIQPCNVTPERGMYGKSETVYYRWGLPAGRGFLPGASFNYRPTDWLRVITSSCLKCRQLQLCDLQVLGRTDLQNFIMWQLRLETQYGREVLFPPLFVYLFACFVSFFLPLSSFVSYIPSSFHPSSAIYFPCFVRLSKKVTN